MDTGARVGKYSVGRKLGQGGFGVLYVARDTELDRELAIKFLRPEHVFRPQVVQRFLQEARAAARINHPGIVTVFECGQVVGTNTRADGTVYIAMELLEGETLALRLRRAPMTLATTLALTRQLAGALAAAHQSGIVHRDLKPGNIFLIADPAIVGGERVKILDFGIAKLTDGFGSNVQTQSMEMLGTPMYMSPEQCKSSAKVDLRSDIYSLGCIVFEMVCGRPPFDGDSGELIAKHQLVPPPFARDLVVGIPPQLDALLGAMLAKSPDQRPQSMAAVIEALDAIEHAPSERSGTVPPHIQASAELATTVASTARGGGVLAALQRHRTLAIGAASAIAIGIALGVATTRGGKDALPAPPIDAQVVVADAASVAIAPAPDAPDDPAYIELDPKTCDQEALLKIAEGSVALGNHGQALKQYEDALRCKSDSHTLQLAFMEACNANNVVKARTHWRALSPELQNRALAICVRNNITRDQLDPDDADAASIRQLKSDCLARVDDGRWADVLTCADKLASRDPTSAAAFRTKASAEIRADGEKGKMESELSNGSLPRARKHLDAIPDESTYKKPAQAEYDTAEQKVVDDFKVRAIRARKANKCADIETLVVQANAQSPRAAAEVRAFKCDAVAPAVSTGAKPCDDEALLKKAEEAVALGNHTLALARYETALACKSDVHTLQLTFMESCNAESLPKARLYWARLTPEIRERALQICVRNHITRAQLEAP